MEIAVMRQRSYPGSKIVIEKELEKGVNYRRYYAYYLSEGLKIYGLLTVPLAQMPEGGFPALVFLHGYIAPAVYRTTERYLAYTDWLSRSGYVVYKIDLRGHDRSEGIAEGAGFRHAHVELFHQPRRTRANRIAQERTGKSEGAAF